MSIIKVTFNYTGANQTFTIPSFVERVLVKAWGAGGGNGQGSSNGGPGGYTMGTLPVTSGQILNVMVGQGGINGSISSTFGGGGAGGNDTSASNLDGSSGGGRSGVSIGAGIQLLIAGGGGGGAGATAQTVWSNGGAGGGLLGINGFISPTGNANAPGGGGTQVSGGAGGIYTTPPNGNGLPGVSLQGGQGGPTATMNTAAGGGGGGGFFGGGGGAGQFTNTANPLEQDAAGGGGSAYIDPIVINGTTLNTAQNTNLSHATTFTSPPNTLDPDYIAGRGIGAVSLTSGGNGLVVIAYDQPNLIMNKTVSNNFSDINSNLTYTNTVNNASSTVTLTNIIFIDTVPSNTTFVPNSLTLNGLILPGTPNPPGITIPSISPGATATVQFIVSIGSTVPSPNRVTNVSSASYSGGFIFNSNVVTTTINNAFLQSIKSTSKVFADIGDIFTYTIALGLSGGITITNVKFIDTIPTGTTFVPNSFTFNGTTIVGANPNPPTGVNLGTIPANALSTVSFQVTLVTKPNPNPIQNTSYTTFNYTVDPSVPNGASGNSLSNNLSSPTYMFVDLQSIKSADFSYIQPNTTITYTVLLQNNGTADARNVIFVDTLPSSITFIPNTFQVNSVSIPGSSLAPLGVNIGTIPAGSFSVVNFQVFAGTLPNGTTIPNSSTSFYKYSIDPTAPSSISGLSTSNIPIINVTTLPIQVTMPNNATFTSTYTTDPSIPNGAVAGANSNTVNNFLSNANLNITKVTSASYAELGYTVTYTISVKNVGTTAANNVIFIDTVPSNVTFVPNSLTLDGATLPGTANPPGINIGAINANGIRTLTFQVLVTTIPSPNIFVNSATSSFLYTIDPSVPNTGAGSDNSNIVTTQVIQGSLVGTKSATPMYVDCGSTILYTVSLSNRGNVPLNNIVFLDTIPSQTSFISNSFVLNGVTIPGANPVTGVNVGSIAVGSSSTINFQVKVVCS